MGSLLGISQKCLYALRALFELSMQYHSGSVMTVAEIADSQKIPARFLEQILSKIKTGGFIESRRGNLGGYVMAVDPAAVTVGQIIRFIEGPNDSIDCLKKNVNTHCPFDNSCVFHDLWHQTQTAVSGILDSATFQELVDKHREKVNQINYTI